MMKRADKAMYKAKNSGRDKLVALCSKSTGKVYCGD